MDDAEPLALLLAIGVPFRIMEMEQRGGPTDAEWAQASAFGKTLGQYGDRLLFKSSARDKYGPSTAEMANELVRVVAVLAFCPGGITLFGQHFEGTPKGSTEEDDQTSLEAPGL